MNKEIFSEGLPYEAYAAGLDAEEQAEFRRSYEGVRIGKDDIEDLGRLCTPLRVAAFSEGWCPDCVINVPVLARIAESACNLELRCFTRSEHPELVKQLNIEKVPTFIFFNEKMEEIARWVERPASIAESLRKGNSAEQRLAKIAYKQGKFQPDTVDEILDLLFA